jgi:dTDP-4-dehydrorhamnose 3,5-epimerase-like enzyme
MLSSLLLLNENADERGKLVVIEGNMTIPFEIKRVFYIYNNKSNLTRGKHAHYKTRQVLITLSGRCTVSLDNLKRKEEVILDSPNKALVLEPNDWHEMFNFSEGCVLMVLASHNYDPEDYIHDYEVFQNIYKEFI